MKKRKTLLLAVLLPTLLLVATTMVRANSPAKITWYVMSSGGGHGSSAHYTLDATMGQPAAGLASSTNFRLGTGFWYVAGLPKVTQIRLFLPIVLKKYP